MRALVFAACWLALACGSGVAVPHGAAKAGGAGSDPVDSNGVGTPSGPLRITLSVTLSGLGRVVSTPAGIDCTGSCSAAFDQGSHVTLTAIPGAGSTFAGWTGACAGLLSCEIELQSAAQLSLSFKPVLPSTGYSIVEIPPLAGMTLDPRSINSRGDVAGIARLNDIGDAHAFFYAADTATTVMLATGGTSSQFAMGINGARQVVGWTLGGSPSSQHAVRWDADGIHDLAALPFPPVAVADGAADAINGRGVAAGWSAFEATIWDPTGPRGLGSGPDAGGEAYAINEKGVAVGYTFPAFEPWKFHAAAFLSDGVLPLGFIDFTDNSIARGINDSGRIVGVSFPSRDPLEWHAFVYDLPAGPMREVAPGRRCALWAVNARGIAVGSCATGAGYDFTARAVILRSDTLEDLDGVAAAPDWVLTFAAAINASGQIVGSGLHNGQPRGFILSPR